MSAAAAQSFDDQLRALVRRYRADDVVASPVESTVVWGAGVSSAGRRS